MPVCTIVYVGTSANRRLLAGTYKLGSMMFLARLTFVKSVTSQSVMLPAGK